MIFGGTGPDIDTVAERGSFIPILPLFLSLVLTPGLFGAFSPLLSLALPIPPPCTTRIGAQTAYIAPGGTDTGDCNSGAPCASFWYATTVSRSIHLAAGTYYEVNNTVINDFSGGSGNIDIIGQGSDNTILDFSGCTACLTDQAADYFIGDIVNVTGVTFTNLEGGSDTNSVFALGGGELILNDVAFTHFHGFRQALSTYTATYMYVDGLSVAHSTLTEGGGNLFNALGGPVSNLHCENVTSYATSGNVPRAGGWTVRTGSSVDVDVDGVTAHQCTGYAAGAVSGNIGRLSNALITDCHAVGTTGVEGGAVFIVPLSLGAVEIESTTISQCSGPAGGVSIQDVTNVTLSDVSILDCDSDESGALAVALGDQGIITLDNVTMDGNDGGDVDTSLFFNGTTSIADFSVTESVVVIGPIVCDDVASCPACNADAAACPDGRCLFDLDYTCVEPEGDDTEEDEDEDDGAGMALVPGQVIVSLLMGLVAAASLL